MLVTVTVTLAVPSSLMVAGLSRTADAPLAGGVKATQRPATASLGLLAVTVPTRGTAKAVETPADWPLPDCDGEGEPPRLEGADVHGADPAQAALIGAGGPGGSISRYLTRLGLGKEVRRLRTAPTSGIERTLPRTCSFVRRRRDLASLAECMVDFLEVRGVHPHVDRDHHQVVAHLIPHIVQAPLAELAPHFPLATQLLVRVANPGQRRFFALGRVLVDYHCIIHVVD